MPQQDDIDEHMSIFNKPMDLTSKQRPIPGSNSELGRLQSNFVGTEFQIFCPSSSKDNHKLHSMDACDAKVLKSRDPDYNPSGGKEVKKRSFNLLRFPRNICRSTADHETNHSNRKGRISPWSEKDFTQHDTEIGAITYTAKLLGNCPRVMDVCIPKAEQGTGQLPDLPSTNLEGEDGGILNSLKNFSHRHHYSNNHNQEEATAVSRLDNLGLMSLQNRPPWWNIELGAFVLNFGGRVSVASVKNFQLCDHNDQENIMLQFGRVKGRHNFTMDFSYPLSPLQAFAISVSSLQSKISFA